MTQRQQADDAIRLARGILTAAAPALLTAVDALDEALERAHNDPTAKEADEFIDLRTWTTMHDFATRVRRVLDAKGKHDGDCETQDRAPAPTFGPFKDRFLAQAYLRGALDALSGSELGAFGVRLGHPRKTDEEDPAYRERIWEAR